MTQLIPASGPRPILKSSRVAKSWSWRTLIALTWTFSRHSPARSPPGGRVSLTPSLRTIPILRSLPGTSIAQDGTGFIWLATQGGLTRWDGYHFRRYTSDPQIPGSLPDSFLLALYVDNRGRRSGGGGDRRRQRELQHLVTARTAELEQRSYQLRESQRMLEQIAYADPLTGLANRRLFEDEMRKRINLISRDGGCLTLLLIDLDGFKSVNDIIGHDAGDTLLRVTAGRLASVVRETDHVARLGGDEFAVVLTQTCEFLSVEIVCRRILSSINQPVPFKDTTAQVSASIGSARCPSQGTATDSLYKSADLALYEAKRSGRNTWRWSTQAPARVWSPPLQETSAAADTAKSPPS